MLHVKNKSLSIAIKINITLFLFLQMNLFFDLHLFYYKRGCLNFQEINVFKAC